MYKSLRKYFIPSQENDFKPHILREAAVGVIALVAVFIFFAGVFQNLLLTKTDLISAVIARTLVDLANSERLASKVGVLMISPTLERAAELKVADMAAKSYFAHVSPEGVEPWYWFRQVGYNYAYAGENLAVNFSESVDVSQAWMNSPLHKKNILDGRFTEIGIATAKGVYNGQETIFVVQMFGRPLSTAAVASTVQNQTTPASPLSQTTVAGATQASPVATEDKIEVLGETESFTSTINPVVAETKLDTIAFPQAPESNSSVIDRLLANPKTTMSFIYVLLGSLVFIALFLNIFIEVRRQHPKHIFYGVALLLLIISLVLAYRSFIFTQVIVI